MSTEQKLWQTLERRKAEWAERAYRIECDTALGIADVFYVPINHGYPGWLELKVATYKQAPSIGAGRPLRLRHPVTAQQADFLYNVDIATEAQAQVLVGVWDDRWTKFALVPGWFSMEMVGLSSIPSSDSIDWCRNIDELVEYLR